MLAYECEADILKIVENCLILLKKTEIIAFFSKISYATYLFGNLSQRSLENLFHNVSLSTLLTAMVRELS